MLKLGIQKKGRLSEKSLQLIKDCGIDLNQAKAKLKVKADNFPLEIYFLRDDDIPVFIKEGIIDVGIVGQNVLEEKASEVKTIQPLGFSKCRLSLAVPNKFAYSRKDNLEGKVIGTTYPNILQRYLNDQNIKAKVVEISGSVEIAPGIGMSDVICDIVSSGSTLLANGLKEVEVIYQSEAVLAGNINLDRDKKEILNEFLLRVEAVLNAKSNKYILLNAPNKNLNEIISIIPGMKAPTVVKLSDKEWSSVQSVVNENDFWRIISQLKKAGAQGILVSPIEKMIL